MFNHLRFFVMAINADILAFAIWKKQALLYRKRFEA